MGCVHIWTHMVRKVLINLYYETYMQVYKDKENYRKKNIILEILYDLYLNNANLYLDHS